MTSPTVTSGFLIKTKRVAATTTALAAILGLGGEDLVPSRYYRIPPYPLYGYQWEVREAYGQRSGDELGALEEFQVIQEFVTKIITQSKDLDPRYDQLISRNFWELV
jgi:hypothetical protein